MRGDSLVCSQHSRITHLCLQSPAPPFVIETATAPGHIANGPVGFLPNLKRCLKIIKLVV